MAGLLVFSVLTPDTAKAALYTPEEIEARAKEFLTEALEWESSRLTVKVKYDGKELNLPEGRKTQECTLPGGKKRVGRVQFSCLVKINGRVVRRIRLHGEIKLAYNLYRTTRTLKRGHIIQPTDVQWVRVESSKVLRNTLSNPKDLIGHRLIRGLGEGDEILTHMLQRVPVVKYGDRILIVAKKGALRVTAPGVVKQEGFKNDTVRVENLHSQKIVFATVIDSRTVEIEF